MSITSLVLGWRQNREWDLHRDDILRHVHHLSDLEVRGSAANDERLHWREAHVRG
jgi:hypothetical protein